MFTMFNFVIKRKIVGKPIERIRNSDIFFKIKIYNNLFIIIICGGILGAT